MRRMLVSLMVLLGLLVLPVVSLQTASAQFEVFPGCDGRTGENPTCQTTGEDPVTGKDGLIFKAILILSYIVGFAAVVMIIIGGLKFITASGNSENIASARNTIIYALVGLAVFAISQTVVRLIISSL